MARIDFNIPDVEKDRLDKTVRGLDTSKAEVLRGFVIQWLDDQDKQDEPVRNFLVTVLDDELYDAAVDKAMHEKTDLAALVRDYLRSWTGT